MKCSCGKKIYKNASCGEKFCKVFLQWGYYENGERHLSSRGQQLLKETKGKTITKRQKLIDILKGVESKKITVAKAIFDIKKMV